MRFTVITPCRNAEHLIADTVRSIHVQAARLAAQGHELEYILVDGASTDATLDVARAAWGAGTEATIRVVSEPDAGMYDALVKGLEMSRGQVISYLNAGDYYSDDCLSVVAGIFKNPQVMWLTGMYVVYTKSGGIFGAKVPWPYSRDLIRRGYHGIRGRGAAIQQESTFWRADALTQVDMGALRRLRYAGDLYLWVAFARAHELYVVSAHLGGFRYHGAHLSDARAAYGQEAHSFIERPRWVGGPLSLMHKVAGGLSPTARRRLKIARRLFYYDINSDSWESA